ncbi:unnamed protein product [Rhizophagus irregularis]|nr:unnamed protein product [Rhizophagus irregularis]
MYNTALVDNFNPTLDSIVEQRESFSSHSLLIFLPSQCERVTNIEIRLKVEEMISQLDELKILLLVVITDKVPAYNAARKRLQVQQFFTLLCTSN